MSVLTYTVPVPPVATTNAATSITTAGATLNGNVNPEGVATTYQFEYGTTTSYGTSSTSTSAGSGSTEVAESAAVSGLAANTVYHYRVEATSSSGTTYGSDQTFTTLPGNTSLPAISGSNVEGATLTTTNGVWSGSVSLTYTYHWQLCNPSCANISGAESSSYTLISADAGHTVDVVVTATNGTGSTSATSSQTSTILALTAPGAPSTPTLSTNSPAYNVSLSSSAGTGSTGGNPEPTYLYQWQRCTTTTTSSCANISGATAQSYTPVSADVGDYLRVGTAATNSVGTSAYTYSAESTSGVTGTTPTSPSTPTLTSNSPAYNTSVSSSAATGSTGTPTPTYTYQWQRCTTTTTSSCANTTGATSQSYTPVSADVGDYLRVGVTATNSVGTWTGASSTVYSAESTSGVTGTTPTTPSTPTLTSNSPAYNTSDSSSAGTGSTGTPALTYTYQWQRCTTASVGSCAEISGATSISYTPVSADVGDYLRVGVTATNSVGTWTGVSSTVYSAESTSGVTGTTPTAPTTPTLTSNSPAYNTSDSSSAGTGSTGTPAPTYSYQWQRCATTSVGSCVNTGGATSQSYTPVGADVGNYLRVCVTATNSTGTWTGTATTCSAESGSGVAGTTPTTPSVPTVTGTTAAGDTLTSSAGTGSTGTPEPTYTYQWQDCTALSSGCSNIGGATSSTYALVSSDVGLYVRVLVTATNSTGTWVGNSSPVASTTPATFINGVAPGAPATPTLTSNSPSYNASDSSSAGTGSTGGVPTPTYNYQWQRCTTTSTSSCANISAATTQSYTPVSADVGDYLRVGVTATNSTGQWVGSSSTVYSAESTSGVTGTTPTEPTAPTLTSNSPAYNVSDSSSAGTGSTGTPTPTYSYQWLRCTTGGAGSCVEISGATSQSYTPVSADVGDYLRVAVTATNSVGTWVGISTTAHSAPSTSGVTGTAPTAPSMPTLASNSPAYNTSDSSSEGTGSTGAPTPTYTYQWQRCTTTTTSSCVEISGATSQSYTPVSADVGDYLRVGVTATNSVGTWTGVSSTIYSSESSSGVTGTTPTSPSTPTVTGTTTVGETLTSSAGTGSAGTPAPTYTYQWQDCTALGSDCTNIGGATSNTYTLVSSDVGLYVRVLVTAMNSVGTWVGSSTPTASTTPTAFINGTGPTNTVLPEVTGTTTDGQVLTTTNGTWSGLPAATFTYQWQDCTSLGSGCTNIGGATSSSYTLTGNDVGSYARAVVTATNSTGQWVGSAAADSATPTTQSGDIAPTSTVAPVVTGTATDGQTLSTTNGSFTGDNLIYTYQWQNDSGAGSSYVNISGATSSTHILSDADVGYKVRALVKATNSAGNATGTSNESEIVQAVPPTNTVAPAVSGEAKDASTLSATSGSWSGAPSPTYSYQWQRNSGGGGSYVNISGATAATYSLTDADVGYKLQVVATASNASSTGGASANATSNETGVVQAVSPVSTSAPAVTGEDKDGSVLTATNGSWSGGPAPTYTYQWQRNSGGGGSYVGISGAIGTTYTLGNADVGYKVRAVVTASNATYTGGSSVSADSNESGVVQAVPPTNTAVPTISGETKDSSTLTATTGSWSGAPSPTYSYQWQRCSAEGSECANIGGATSSTYTLTDMDIGHTIDVVVTASNTTYTGGGSASMSSAASSAVASSAPAVTGSPVVSGEVIYGSVLTTTNGTWTGSPTPTYTYQWQRCSTSEPGSCSNISGATSQSYTITEDDVGNYFRVGVTATNSGGHELNYSLESSSGAAGVPPGVPSDPTLSSNSAAVGVPLTASVGTGSEGGVPAPTYLYQWQLCTTTEASSCSDISGATSRSYTPTAEDVGKFLRVGDEATNSTGTWVDPSEPAYSPEDGPVMSEGEECENVSPAPGGSTPTGPAVACTEVGETVTGYGLTLTAPTTKLATTTLGAKDGIAAYSIAELTGDETGTGHGWAETISQTTFTSGSHTIGSNSGSGELFEQTTGAGKVGKESGNTGAAVTAVGFADAVENTDTNPTETEVPVTLPLNVPVPTTSHTATAGDAPSVVFQTASLESGLGNFIITPTVSFDVPANTYSGSYTATTEVDLSTGP